MSEKKVLLYGQGCIVYGHKIMYENAHKMKINSCGLNIYVRSQYILIQGHTLQHS